MLCCVSVEEQDLSTHSFVLSILRFAVGLEVLGEGRLVRAKRQSPFRMMHLISVRPYNRLMSNLMASSLSAWQFRYTESLIFKFCLTSPSIRSGFCWYQVRGPYSVFSKPKVSCCRLLI